MGVGLAAASVFAGGSMSLPQVPKSSVAPQVEMMQMNGLQRLLDGKL